MSQEITLNVSTCQRQYDTYRSLYPQKRISDLLSFDTHSTISENLDQLALFSLESSTGVYHAFRPIFVELAARLVDKSKLEREYCESRNLSPSGYIVLEGLSRVYAFADEVGVFLEVLVQKRDFFSDLPNVPSAELQSILLSFFRMLNKDYKRFQRYVRPTILYSLLDKEISSVCKFLVIQVLCISLSLSESVCEEMQKTYIFGPPLGDYDGEENVDYTFFPIFESGRVSNFEKLQKMAVVEEEEGDIIVLRQQDFSKGVSLIFGVLVTNLYPIENMKKSQLVPIEKTVDSLRQLAQNVTQNKPTMLVGKAGCGKTFIVNELASMLKMDEMSVIKIHLNEQTDSKMLLGTYTSDTKPGTFKWKHGVLTTAVLEGKWVLVEDIDRAPTEVLSILLTLLEKRQLVIPSRGEVFHAANGFQLVSTVQVASESVKNTVPDMIGLQRWSVVEMEPLEVEDLKVVISQKYPLLHNFKDKFVACYLAVHKLYHSKKFASMNKGSQPRVISMRDLVKFCSRCEQLLKGVTSALMPSEIYDEIFQEACDCFTSSIVEKQPREVIAAEVGLHLEVPTSRINLYLNKNVPSFSDGEVLKCGRATLEKSARKSRNKSRFARTSHSLRLMEQLAVGVSMCEPILLVGETGTGKTTVVQEMARMLNKKITVINVSQQTEVGDLLGGYKPVNQKMLALPLQEDFEDLFHKSFSAKKNEHFLKVLSKCFNRCQWKNVVKLWKEAVRMARASSSSSSSDNPSENSSKRRKVESNEWDAFLENVDAFAKKAVDIENSFVFDFVEGSLVKSVRNGDWLLLDEINLATPETLESIADLLSEDHRNLLLSEKGEIECVRAHPQFRIFGCMNPSTDVGKKELPQGIRSRFTELYVHSPDEDIQDLLMIIDKYIGAYSLADEWCGNDIAQLYLEAKRLSENNEIVDGANQRPHFSIRTLTRTLVYVCDIVSVYGLRRSLFEGFCMSFLTLLDLKSETKLKQVIEKYTIARLGNARSVLSQVPPAPPGGNHVPFKQYWMERGSNEPKDQPHYIMTPFVEKNMLNLVRASSGRRFPVLIQGPTSSGKTSMIRYLATITGHEFVRINNHEHTDLQEYLGTYVSDPSGKLVFREGVLVEALRKGHWIVLDELNLAPTDVLEALNRLLDDNRELFIPETQETVKPHPHFMLFATQNPPGIYGGRKILSRAFRNRFLELHFDEIPESELEVILRERCQIAPSYAGKIVEVYRQLSVQRQSTRLFEQKNSFATLRDLFRWAQRDAVGYEQLAANGYMLLAERVRRSEEKRVVRDVIEKVMKVRLDMQSYYANLENSQLMEMPGSVIWTKAARRLAVLVSTALQQNEPVLLVGETGCGKTTMCELLARFSQKKLVSVNAHQNTETGDLLGAQRPLRNRSELQQSVKTRLENLPERETPDELLQRDIARSKMLFEWTDGPLVQAMKEGDFFLLDEISLADDSVLERLNSVLEPERSLLLAEMGTDHASVTASGDFQFLATMNPGGDYGKKELSPALRNRFTEIWVPSMDDFDDVRQIVECKLVEKGLTEKVVSFTEWFGSHFGVTVSLRDVLAWVQFINTIHTKYPDLDRSVALVHGASMVYIDALGTNSTSALSESPERLSKAKAECFQKLDKECGENNQISVTPTHLFSGFLAIVRRSSTQVSTFKLDAPTTARNTMRVVRAMQVHKPILLEGSPGVGKTSLVEALASVSGNKLTRINLSEQTDLVDLFGADAPTPGGSAGEFVWKDAPFLRAMQKGEWVLLDEMNLASQSVLEGLNACLDHRGNAYIPELDRSFQCHPDFVVFAAQNPQHQGGGRKGLPKSFVNRFSVVYMDTLTSEDIFTIVTHRYPQVDGVVISKMIQFVSILEERVVRRKQWGVLGSEWEFNLRDTIRWLELVVDPHGFSSSPGEVFHTIVEDRFRTAADRQKASDLFLEVFGQLPTFNDQLIVGDKFVLSGKCVLPRSSRSEMSFLPLHCNNRVMTSAVNCVLRGWPLILVGPSNAGKTELVRVLAGLAGARLDEFSMNSDIDSMDLLGGYEQVDLVRVESELKQRIREAASQLELSPVVLDLLETLGGDLSHVVPVLETIPSLSGFLPESHSLIRKEQKVRFEWFDGTLVQAVEKGHWLVLDNANLCSPSVLDRLNSLLEPNGKLIINECSLENGEPRVVNPHPNFRLFLTLNPKYGELSRAMRNRGIEVYMDSLNERASHWDMAQIARPAHLVSSGLVPLLESLAVGQGEDLANAVCSFLSPASCKLIAHSEKLSCEVDSQLFEQLQQRVDYLEKHLLHTLEVDSLHSFFPLNPLLQPDVSHTPEMGYFLSTQLCTMQFERVVERISFRALSAKVSDLNYLEKSTAVALQRDIRNPPRLQVFSLVSEILSFIQQSKSSSALFQLQTLWTTLVDCAERGDESRLRVCKQLLVEWSENNHISFETLSHLGSSLELTSGLCISALWEHYRKEYPPSAESWSALRDIEKLSKTLHRLSSQLFPDSESTVADLYATLQDLKTLAIRSSFDLTPVAETVDSLQSSVNGFLVTRVKLFQPEFEKLANIVGMSQPPPAALCLRANREVLSSTQYPFAVEFSPELSGAFVRQICEKTLSAPITGKNMSQALVDLRTLASDTVKHSEQVLSPQRNLRCILNDWIADVASVNEDLTLEEEDSLGKSWIKFALKCLKLYVPSSPFDPAISDHVKYDTYSRHKSHVCAIRESWVTVRKAFYGDVPLSAEDLLPTVGEPPAKPRVFRPSESIDPLFDEWKGFTDSAFVQAEKLMSSQDGSIQEQIGLFQRNCTSFLGRLHDRFFVYADLNDILRGFVLSLKFGFELLKQEIHKPACSLPLTTLVDPTALATDASVLQAFEVVSGVCKNEDVAQIEVEKVLLLFLRLFYAHPHLKELFFQVVQMLYYRWSLRRMKEAEEARSKEQLFKFEDESSAEKEFQQLFPDFENVLTISDHVSVAVDFSDVYAQLAKLFVSQDPGSLMESLLESGQAMGTLSQMSSFLEGEASTGSLAGMVSLMYNQVEQMEDTAQSVNFYHGHIPGETLLSNKVVQDLHCGVQKLVAQWPEHATLQQLDSACEEFSLFDVKTPVARLLQKMEQLYTLVAEWEKYAHSKVSLQTHMDELTKLVVRWRKLELSSWQDIFHHEDAMVEKRAGGWWFHLFETVALPLYNGEEHNTSAVLTAINVFLSQTTFGEFPHRLALLRAFSRFLKDAFSTSLLENTVSFYEMFVPVVSDRIAQGRKVLEKDIKEVILLASWKDVNVEALKQSARKSHASLFKIVRKYRALINESVTGIIENGISTKCSVHLAPLAEGRDFEADTDVDCAAISTWKDRSLILQNIGSLKRNLGLYVKKVEACEVPSLYPFCKDILSEMERLRTETPSQQTEENKKEVAALKTQKRKLLSDTLKELKRSGLRLRLTTDVQKTLVSVTFILGNTASLPCKEEDGYFMRVLDLLPRLRRAVSEPNEEVPVNDAQKGLCACENLLYSMVSQRKPLADCYTHYDKLMHTLEGLRDVAERSTPTAVPVRLTAQFERLSMWLPKLLDLFQGVPSAPSFAELGSGVAQLVARYNELSSQVTSDAHVDFLQDVAKFVSDAHAHLGNNFMGLAVSVWLGSFNFSLQVERSGTVELVEASFRKLTATILVCVQDVVRAQKELSEDDDMWLSENETQLKQLVSLLRLRSVERRLDECIQMLYGCGDELSRRVVQFSYPVILSYSQLAKCVLEKTRSNYVELGHSTLILMSSLYTLCTEGFCSPEPPSETKESDNLEQGTGLGDGEGASAKDGEEEDEDLEENAQQQNDEQPDEENDKDAVEMSGDMAGENGNASDQEEEDDGENEEMDEEVDDLDDADPNAVDDKMWDDEANSEKEKQGEDVDSKEGEMEAMESGDEKEGENEGDEGEGEGEEGEEGDEEEGEEGDEGEDVGEQDDNVRNEEGEEMDENVPDMEGLDLPDDMNLDDEDDEENENQNDDGEGMEQMDKLDEDGSDGSDKDASDQEMENASEGEDSNGSDEEMEVEGELQEESLENQEEPEEESENQENPLEDQEEPLENQQNSEELQENQPMESGLDAEGADETEKAEDNTTEANAGTSAQGGEAEAEAETEAVGSSGTAQSQVDEKEDESHTDESRDQARESLQQLGDALKEFYRRRQEIQQSSEASEDQSGENPEAFEHTDQAETTTQAMGSASMDQVQSLNDDNAIDEVEEESERAEEVDENQSTAMDPDVEMSDLQQGEAGAETNGITRTFEQSDRSSEEGRVQDQEEADEYVKLELGEDLELSNEGIPPRSLDESSQLWKESELATQELASGLCEQLRLILEPTLATKLKGDYKTGKRLNMKRIIPFIASQFRKDKIWLKRTKPSKRQYQVMIAVDDSKSMSETKSVSLAFQSIALVSKALTQLESGGLCVVKFGESTKVVHPFDKPFTQESGPKIFQWFDFQQTRTDIRKLVNNSLTLFDTARATGNADLWQLQIIISDGVCEDHATIQRLVRQAREEKIMLVFVVVDGIASNESILDMSQVSYVPDANGNLVLKMDKYLDTFPFEFYVVVHDIHQLPEMLALILRQYFTELASV